jgi:hypothetical protein
VSELDGELDKETLSESAKITVAMAEKACEEHGFLSTIVVTLVERDGSDGGSSHVVECAAAGSASPIIMLHQSRALLTLAGELKATALARLERLTKQAIEGDLNIKVQGGFRK